MYVRRALEERPPENKCCERRCEMSEGNVGNIRKVGEWLNRHFPCIHARVSMLSRGCTRGAIEFSRLPDSATLAPLRMVELALGQNGVRSKSIVVAIDCGAAYPEGCDFSIGFLSGRGPIGAGRPTMLLESKECTGEFWCR